MKNQTTSKPETIKALQNLWSEIQNDERNIIDSNDNESMLRALRDGDIQDIANVRLAMAYNESTVICSEELMDEMGRILYEAGART